MHNLIKLIDCICDTYDSEEYKPKGGITYCNQAVNNVAFGLGYFGFKSMNANQMIDHIESSSEWDKCDHISAQDFSNIGRFVIAGKKNLPHGHVVVIRPGISIYSNKYKTYVPRCLNIGSDIFIAKFKGVRAGTNWAFPEMPIFYYWKNS